MNYHLPLKSKVMIKLQRFHESMLPYFEGYRISREVRDFIICQFALESNFGDSRLAKECYNYCGMKFPQYRLCKSIGKDDQSLFAIYRSIQDCVDDYFLCLQFHRLLYYMCQDIESFKAGISWYCPEKDYISRITNLYNQLKS